MTSKRRTPDRPFCFCGRITFEFFNNDDEDFKVRTLKGLAKGVRKEANVSCILIEEDEVANPERGTLLVACVAVDHARGKTTLDRCLAFLDGKAPARILLEDFMEAEVG